MAYRLAKTIASGEGFDAENWLAKPKDRKQAATLTHFGAFSCDRIAPFLLPPMRWLPWRECALLTFRISFAKDGQHLGPSK